jgi:hydroxymethylglutaryl-CoA reductase
LVSRQKIAIEQQDCEINLPFSIKTPRASKVGFFVTTTNSQGWMFLAVGADLAQSISFSIVLDDKGCKLK